jgi:elongation factor Tu
VSRSIECSLSDVQGVLDLVHALDRHIPEPVRDVGSPFLMPIEGVNTIEGRGTVTTGRVSRGVLKLHDEVEIVGRGDSTLKAVVTGIQEFHKDVPEAVAGHNVGLLLRGIDRDAVVRGQTLIAPGSISPHRVGRAEIFLLSADEGGRTTPCGTGYTPQFYFGATDVPGTLRVDDDVLKPGDRREIRTAPGPLPGSLTIGTKNHH